MKIPLSNEIERIRYGDKRQIRFEMREGFNPMKYKIFFNKDEIMKFRDLNYYLVDVTTMNDPLLAISKYFLNMPNETLMFIEEEQRN